jgi:topoisomerase-4 subunit A
MQTTFEFGAGDAGGTAVDDSRLTLADYAQRAYLDYAISVVKGRALPDVCDGQKPVQRRILYAMRRMGLEAQAKPVKSARVVGDVLGRFHPHGDTAAYDALVRMAQPFALRYPLVDGQGNFGSRDGDGAAAMRYTEARLTPIARLLLDEIDAGTVDFQPNYDGSTEEPRLLPARLPFVLLNGASGIAVGLATEIPSHNLREVAAAAVALLREPGLGLDEVLALLPGPDYPGGGQVISSPADIREAYAGGRGSLKVRARWTFEELARGQWQMVVTELPPGTSAARVLEEVEELTNPKLKAGKKTLTAEQQQLKAQVLAVLDAVRDESSKDAPVRLVFEPRSSRIDREQLATTLLALTSMESNAPVNLTMIGADGKPKQKGLLDILREWLEFRLATVTRRTRHRLGEVDARIHILEGRRLVLLHIDEVIAIIRGADEPKPALMQRFALSERQADDILDIRLRQLARLEAIRIDEELARLADEKRECEALLADERVLRRAVVREIEADAKAHGDARRTLIQHEQKTVVEVKVADEPVTVIVSAKGWVRTQKGHADASQPPPVYGVKAGDSLYGAFECRSVDTLVALGDQGRAYSVAVAQLPGGRGDGQPLSSLVELAPGSQFAHFHAGAASDRLLLATARGLGFACSVGDMTTRVKAGRAFLDLDAGDRPLALARLPAAAEQLALLSSGGRLLLFAVAEVKTLANGGRGVILMELDDGETLVGVQPLAAGQGLTIHGSGRGGAPRSETLGARALSAYVGKRARKGRKLDVSFKPMGLGEPPPKRSDT